MRRVKKKKQILSIKSKIWILVLLALGIGSIGFYRSEYYGWTLTGIRASYVSLMKKTQLVLKQAKVQGHIRTKANDILRVTDLSLGMPIFDVDLNQIHEEITRLPWIKVALIERQLPSSLLITVQEKMPIAMWQNNKKYLPLDEEGQPIQDEKTKLPDLILVVGRDAPAHTVALLKTLNQYPDIRDRVKSAVRVGNRRWDLILDKVDGLVIELPEKNIEEALNRLQESMKKDKIFQKNIASINLREKDQLIVTLGGKK